MSRRHARTRASTLPASASTSRRRRRRRRGSSATSAATSSEWRITTISRGRNDPTPRAFGLMRRVRRRPAGVQPILQHAAPANRQAGRSSRRHPAGLQAAGARPASPRQAEVSRRRRHRILQRAQLFLVAVVAARGRAFGFVRQRRGQGLEHRLAQAARRLRVLSRIACTPARSPGAARAMANASSLSRIQLRGRSLRRAWASRQRNRRNRRTARRDRGTAHCAATAGWPAFAMVVGDRGEQARAVFPAAMRRGRGWPARRPGGGAAHAGGARRPPRIPAATRTAGGAASRRGLAPGQRHPGHRLHQLLVTHPAADAGQRRRELGVEHRRRQHPAGMLERDQVPLALCITFNTAGSASSGRGHRTSRAPADRPAGCPVPLPQRDLHQRELRPVGAFADEFGIQADGGGRVGGRARASGVSIQFVMRALCGRWRDGLTQMRPIRHMECGLRAGRSLIVALSFAPAACRPEAPAPAENARRSRTHGQREHQRRRRACGVLSWSLPASSCRRNRRRRASTRQKRAIAAGDLFETADSAIPLLLALQRLQTGRSRHRPPVGRGARTALVAQGDAALAADDDGDALARGAAQWRQCCVQAVAAGRRGRGVFAAGGSRRAGLEPECRRRSAAGERGLRRRLGGIPRRPAIAPGTGARGRASRRSKAG